uniref:C2H2-type domain-containing protein n=1 Tax=Caenorhabditis tropicalis TaxID=1561998 RepID=A0A1I7TLW6_9PELO
MEQTLKPDTVLPKKVDVLEEPDTLQNVDSEPDQEFFIAQEQEFEDDIPHYPIDEVLIESTQATRPKTTLKSTIFHSQNEAGVFCFNCKGTFNSYNQYQLHLHEDYNNGDCSKALPEHYYFERNDRTMMFNKNHRHSVMHHKPIKRDVSHIQCTLCKAVNFATTGDLYAHMIKCAASASNDEDSPINCPTAFGYGFPPSFNACQYVFPDPARDKVPRQSSSKEKHESEL